jgi:[FeFe] hydrogenase H-cluster maturation GTPase HydF
MQKTPKSLRLQIGVYGRRNVGKSSFINAVTRQQVSIVSDVPGTTTDPVEKAMELLPIGPVLFIDTAGLDDAGALGQERIAKSRKAMERTDLGVVVAFAPEWDAFEDALVEELRQREIPVVVVFNKCDVEMPGDELLERLAGQGLATLCITARTGENVGAFRETLLDILPDDMIRTPTIIGDLIRPSDTVVLVVPIDLEAPKGRLIMPQVQTIRDALDHDACCMVVKERELRMALDNLRRPPALVVTDSQAFLRVAGDTPDEIPMTSFSILMARVRGDLPTFVEGARAIDDLRSGDRILVAEGCTHHPIGEDIGRVKLPRWIRQYTGARLEFDTVQGHDFPEDLSPYRLVAHCGSCTFNRRQLLHRVLLCREAGVPITNYGVAIAYSLGIFERALSPFAGLCDVRR